MGGQFATGFLSSISDAAKKKADDAHDAANAQKKSQADIYWGVIKNPDSTPDQINYAHDQLGKLYPKDPQIKQLFDKFRGLIQQTHPGHQQGGAQDPNAPPAPGGAQGPIPPPPQPGAAAAAPTATRSIATPAFNPNAKSAIPPPPQPSAAKPTFADMAHRAAGPSSDEQDARELKQFRAHQDILRQNRIDEEDAKAKARAQYGTGGAPPRPVFSHPTSVLDSRSLAKNGKVYEGEDGNPIDVEKLPDNMSLQPFTARITETDDQGNSHQVWKTRYLPTSPNQKSVKVGGVDYEVNPADASKIPQGAGTAVGATQVPSTTSKTDPATQQTTVAKHVPTITGAAGRGGGAASSGGGTTPTAPAAVPSGKTPLIAKSPSATPPSTPSAPPAPATQTPRGLPPLDADGHVPAVGGSPQVVEGANQLLDGQDVNKLPAKTRDLSAAMARKYGWEQGKFTPKEQLLLRESTTFLDDALKNPSLKVLDEGFFDRQKLAQVVDTADSRGVVHRAVTSLAAQNLTDDQAEFVRMYNQLVGTISGLGQLSRANRTTEAAIKRLMLELPNPLTVKDSADATKRLKRLRNEVDVAMKKGTFTGADETTTSSSTRKSSIPAPPKPDGTAGNIIHWTRDPQGNPIPAPSAP